MWWVRGWVISDRARLLLGRSNKFSISDSRIWNLAVRYSCSHVCSISVASRPISNACSHGCADNTDYRHGIFSDEMCPKSNISTNDFGNESSEIILSGERRVQKNQDPPAREIASSRQQHISTFGKVVLLLHLLWDEPGPK